MPIYEITTDTITAIPATSFAEAGIRERIDLQRRGVRRLAGLDLDIRSTRLRPYRDGARTMGSDSSARVQRGPFAFVTRAYHL